MECLQAQKLPHFQDTHMRKIKAQSMEFQTRNSTAERERQFSETEF